MTDESNPTKKSASYFLSLCVRGKSLDPTVITAALGLKPDYQHAVGEKFPLRTGGFGYRKLSIWSLDPKEEKFEINEAISFFCDLYEKKVIDFNKSGGSILCIDGVDDAYIDILVHFPSVRSSNFFDIDPSVLLSLSNFKIPAHFTFYVD
jgi:hypothetical protein